MGEIAVGKRADLVVLDDQHPSLICKSESQILDAAIFACNQLPVKDVYVAGKQQIESGKHKNDQPSLASYKRVIKKLSDIG